MIFIWLLCGSQIFCLQFLQNEENNAQHPRISENYMEKLSFNPLFERSQNPWLMLFALIGITLGGVLLIGQILAIVAGIMLTGDGLTEIQQILLNPFNHPEHRITVLVMQGLSSFGGFIIAPLIFYYVMVKGNFLHDFFRFPSDTIRILIITLFMVFSFMIVNTVFIEWNANVKLPAFLSGFEKWASELEESMADLTKFLTEFESTGYFVLAVLIVAVVPGIGEELIFRGFLQNIFRKMLKNDHLAIWLAAFVFSAIHFQFYGFVPRMVLGALFGYLYLWTGNLLVPVFAHFLNNGISLLSLFVYQKGLIDFDAESTEAFPWPAVLIFTVLFLFSLIYFRNNISLKNDNEGLDRSV